MLQAVLTVAVFLASFILGTYPGYVLLFNIIFSYLWLVVVVFTARERIVVRAIFHSSLCDLDHVAVPTRDRDELEIKCNISDAASYHR